MRERLNVGNIVRRAGAILAAVGLFELSRSAIVWTRKDESKKIIAKAEKSAPIIYTEDLGYGSKTVSQTLVGKEKGGQVITDTTVFFHHEPDSSFRRIKTQRLGKDKQIKLTDGSNAKGV